MEDKGQNQMILIWLMQPFKKACGDVCRQSLNPVVFNYWLCLPFSCSALTVSIASWIWDTVCSIVGFTNTTLMLKYKTVYLRNIYGPNDKMSCVFEVNEKTTKVIEAAFQHARYPSVKGEKSILFIGKVIYGLDKWVDTYLYTHVISYKEWCHVSSFGPTSLEIHNLSIGRSMFELHPGEGIAIEIQNVSAVFKGTIQYGYGSWM